MTVLKIYNENTDQWEPVVVGKQGPQGIQGPQGPQGETSPRYSHEQTSASSTWVINHNLNKYPIVAVIDSSGTEVFCNTEHTSKNQSILYFTAAMSGRAELI